LVQLTAALPDPLHLIIMEFALDRSSWSMLESSGQA
jgi:hypothetical protein